MSTIRLSLDLTEQHFFSFSEPAIGGITRADTGFGAVDFGAIISAVDKVTYIKWSDKDRYDIGMPLNMAQQQQQDDSREKFQNSMKVQHALSKRSTKKNIMKGKENGTTLNKSIPKHKTNTGRPLALGELDVMVQKYIRALSNRRAVTSRAGAIAAATALLKKYPKIVGKIDLESSSWAKSLFMRMGYVRRKNTSSKVEIPNKARKEIDYQFHFDIVSKSRKYNIPKAFIINLDWTQSYLVLCKKFTMAPKAVPM